MTITHFASMTATALLLLATLASGISGAVAAESPGLKRQIERGRYLVNVAGCNTCHTAGFLASGLRTPESSRLTGSDIGHAGPWGVSYPTNLRLYFDLITEEQWLRAARETDRRPAMPYFALNAMSTSDLRAIYRYIRHLGPAGEPAPRAVAAGEPSPANAPLVRYGM